MTGITISSAFDSGNIIPVAVEGDTIRLEIAQDAHSDFYQWFHFRALGVRGRDVTYRIENCAASAYPAGWPG